MVGFMRPRQEASEEQVKELELAIKQETRRMQQRRLQCVWLRVKHDMSTAAVAQATGFCVSQVWRIWSQYFRGSVAAIRQSKGGRRNECLTAQEEAEFLETHLAQARQGWILTARAIKESYEKKVGHKVPDSTVCRMLKRHQWRRVSTRPTHPHGDPAAREEFKKNSARKWQPPGWPSPV
jgi:transposase